ncbi:MAG: decaprenyl-phosphate phosphoribosyltransferase [Candidatus Sumerlaeia bacterium]
MLKQIILECRPRQWTKNLLLFAGVLFTGRLQDPASIGRAVAAFVIFCALSSVVYIINDLKDLDSDRQHPVKRHRPLASGDLPVGAAVLTAAVLTPAALILSFLINTSFGCYALAYFILLTLYSFHLKHVVILDIMLVAVGFVIRAIAGIEVLRGIGGPLEITSWFIVCALFLSLFLAICKRRNELVLLNANAGRHRRVLEEYSEQFLDQMMAVATTGTILTYALWSVQGKFHGMIYTLPFVVFGIFRYLYLVYKRDQGGAPEIILLTDRPLQVNIVLWLATTVGILYGHLSFS